MKNCVVSDEAKCLCIAVCSAWLLSVDGGLFVYFFFAGCASFCTEWRTQRNNRIFDAVKVFLARLAKQGIVPVLVTGHQGDFSYLFRIDVHGFCDEPEFIYKLAPGTVVVETQVVVHIRGGGEHSPYLHIGGRAAGGDKHAFLGKFGIVTEGVTVQLVECHRIVAAFKPGDTSGLMQRFSAEIGYPQAFAAVAALGFALVAAAAVHLGTSTFF